MAKYKSNFYEALNFESAATYEMVACEGPIPAEGTWPDGRPKDPNFKWTLNELWTGGDLNCWYYIDQKFGERMASKGIVPGVQFQLYKQGTGKDTRYYERVVGGAATPQAPVNPAAMLPTAPQANIPQMAQATPAVAPAGNISLYDLEALMGRCLEQSLALWTGLGIQHTSDNVQAVGNALFIEANRKGLAGSVKETAPPAPAPQQAPQQAPQAAPAPQQGFQPDSDDLPF